MFIKIQEIFLRLIRFYNSVESIYPDELKLKSRDRVLVLAPHPDDEVMGCGGLLIKYPNQCDVVFLTDGRYGAQDSSSPSEMILIRKKEAQLVSDLLKTNKTNFLEIEDTKLEDAYKTFSKIKFDKYDYLFIPNNLDLHPDHIAVAKHIKTSYYQGRIPQKTQIMMYEVWSALGYTNKYVDISDVVSLKKKLINSYVSQVNDVDYASRILALNKFRGMTVDKEYIESYWTLSVDSFSKI
jgi:LmbE family N-acetylglucosaminyl deacetylase